jgi:uncharacterized membrane protein YkvA (DUF1232 family)
LQTNLHTCRVSTVEEERKKNKKKERRRGRRKKRNRSIYMWFKMENLDQPWKLRLMLALDIYDREKKQKEEAT